MKQPDLQTHLSATTSHTSRLTINQSGTESPSSLAIRNLANKSRSLTPTSSSHDDYVSNGENNHFTNHDEPPNLVANIRLVLEKQMGSETKRSVHESPVLPQLLSPQNAITEQPNNEPEAFKSPMASIHFISPKRQHSVQLTKSQ